MNTKADAMSVLVYGDSNVHGQKPDRSGRFDAVHRWTGVLQSRLGEAYYVIEEGLGGRTTNLDHPNPSKPSRNGLAYFKACLDSHSPLDVVAIMLGTNDFKTTYNRSTQEIAAALEAYITAINASSTSSSTPRPKIIIISPPYMNQEAPMFYTSMPTPGIYDETSVAKSHELALHLERLASANGALFLDAAQITETGEDGCHMTESSHQRLGTAIAEMILELSYNNLK